MMKFTLGWLKEHLDTDAPLAAIIDKLTMIGLEVECVADRGKALAPFSIARVISAEQHPNADRLRVCMVDTGAGEPVQVVCGAPNARSGMKGVFVPPGAFIPGKNMTLGVGKIRGVESRGMLVSEFELKISDNHEGIIELPGDAPVGASYAQWAGLDDPVIEINLTPNRADCAGVNGIARDLAAAGMGRYDDRPVTPVRGGFPCPTNVTLDFGATPSLCPAFGLRLVRGVRNAPSPQWLARRLTAIGLRPINTLVDITNFITYDRGRPLHVFDAAKVKGNLTVRRAHAGEKLTALDGKCYELDETMCVIADEQGVVSLAGIMGGAATGCSHETTDVLIESALWDAPNVAHTGRKLGINSDARYRFERGVDPAFMLPGLDLAGAMVLDLCGGEPSEVTVAGKVECPERSIDFPFGEVARLSGLDLDVAEVTHVLGRLGFGVAGQGTLLKIRVPSWRADVHGKADIVEEIIRIVGVDRLPATPFDRGDTPRQPVLTPFQVRGERRRARSRRAGWWNPSPGHSLRRIGPKSSAEAHATFPFITRSHRTFPTCGRASFRDLRRLRKETPIAASPTSRCSRWGRFSRATVPKTSSPPPPACARGLQEEAAADATGRHPPSRWTPSMPRPTHWRCSRQQAHLPRRCKPFQAVPPGCIRDAAAPSRSVRKTCSAISGSCIRASLKRSMRAARWLPSKSFWNEFLSRR